MAQKETFDLRGFPSWAEAHLKIIDEFGELIPLKLNEVQLWVFEKIATQYETLNRVDAQILKARQMGISTLIQALLFYFMMHQRYKNALTIAHKDNSTQFIYNMQRIFYDNLDKGKPEFRKWNRSGIEFNTEAGDGLNNRIMVETAGSADIGRAFTLHFIHCSEVASWDKLVDKKIDVSGLFGGLNQAIRDRAGSIKFLESTAQGEGYFKTMWYDPPPNRLNLFRSWVAMRTYRLEVTEEQKREIAETPDARYGDEYKEAERIRQQLQVMEAEENYHPEKGIEHEVWCKLAWRRHIIRSTCEGKLAIFRQEYPTVEEDAFRSADFAAFDTFYLGDRLNEVQSRKNGGLWKVDHYRRAFDADAVSPETPGWWRDALPVAEHGDIAIFADPEDGKRYFIGADSCYGTNQNEAAFVVWDDELFECASFHASMDADKFAEMLFAVGFGYNKALIAPELQGPGLSTIHRLEQLRYPNIYRMDSLNRFAKQKKQNSHGFYNNLASKPRLAGIMRTAIRERRATFNNPDFIKQLMAFHEIRRGGLSKFEAASGHQDDMVIAGAIGLYISGLVERPEEIAAAKMSPDSIAFHVDNYKRAERRNAWLANA